jgi:hypothetical protein
MVIIAIAHTKKGGGFFSRLIMAITTSNSMRVKPRFIRKPPLLDQ